MLCGASRGDIKAQSFTPAGNTVHTAQSPGRWASVPALRDNREREKSLTGPFADASSKKETCESSLSLSAHYEIMGYFDPPLELPLHNEDSIGVPRAEEE